ncbi:hypothetical protein RFH07_13735 [Acinetobacter seifertii]|uniref:hypothetical protein n=2 Tax=Acinetobacter calcoaceticus/baumannii complex TaxID=909768 RepID=UPI00280CA70C|nr:hypothetical protein [Acinetobacter seifertii]MDQ9037660.1 hypothetical protein [Acinetobacter seifertii]
MMKELSWETMQIVSDVYQTRKRNLLLLIKYSSSRSDFADLIGSGYNNLNQYLSQKNPKPIGSKYAEKITNALKLPYGWLDSPQDENTVKVIMKAHNTSGYDASTQNNQKNVDDLSSANQNNPLKMIPLMNILKISKGENLEVTENIDETKNVYAPPGIVNPIAYLIKGTGYSKPYRNGYTIICEFSGTASSGAETLIFTKDDKIFAGEFLYEQDILIAIDSIDGEKINILKENIARISPIKAFLAPDL